MVTPEEADKKLEESLKNIIGFIDDELCSGKRLIAVSLDIKTNPSNIHRDIIKNTVIRLYKKNRWLNISIEESLNSQITFNFIPKEN